jgi:hypothetical protein
MAEVIKIDGLAQFARNLKKLDGDLPKALRRALNEASGVVVDEAVQRVPTRTGRARSSLKAKSTRTESRIGGGSNKAPHYPWLDFGGEGRIKGRPAKRPFIKQGRYLYAAYFERRGEFDKMLSDALLRVADSAGIEVN